MSPKLADRFGQTVQVGGVLDVEIGGRWQRLLAHERQDQASFGVFFGRVMDEAGVQDVLVLT